jgi:hypothetical protein
MSNIKVDYDILNQKQTPAFYASSLATRPAFGFPGRIFIDTDTPSSGIYRDTGSAWVQVADPGAGTTGTLQQVTTNGNTTTLGISVQGIAINDGAGTGSNNIAIGTGALLNNTTGQANIAIGLSALNFNTTGYQNAAFGLGALQSNTTGGANTAVGHSALQENTTANSNTAIGFESLKLNTTGANNVAIGLLSLTANTFGLQNTAVGSGALSSNTTASGNTAVGYNSLAANTTGISNTAVGISSLAANTTGQSNSSFGILSLQTNTTGNYNTAIGANSLQVNTTGANNTSVGAAALQLNTTGANNTAVGYASMTQNTTASDNTAIGYSSLNLNTTGSQNTAIGRAALNNNLTGNNNVSVGYNSLTQNSSGTANTAIGYQSLAGNTTANNNTAIGYASLQVNSTGAGNTGIGYGSLSSNTTGGNNVALGNSALIGSTTASSNTAVGTSALTSATTGGQNTAIGINAGSNISTGTNNSFVGISAGIGITTGSNNTILGNAGTLSATLTSNIILADGGGNTRLFSDANGLIGINQAVGSVPGGQLDIHTSQTYALVLNGLTTNNAYTAFSNNSVGKWRIGNTYNAGANTFDIFNLGTSSTALSFNSTTNAGSFVGNVIATTGITGAAIKLSGFANYGTILDVNDVRRIWFENTGSFRTIFDLPASGTSFDFRTNAGTSLFSISSAGAVNATDSYGLAGAAQSLTWTTNTLRLAQGSYWQNVELWNGTTIVLKTTNTANVLIGTTTDAGYKLEVNGTARATDLRTSTDLYLDRTSVAPAIVLNQSSIRIVDAAGSSTTTISSIGGNFQVSASLKTAAPSGGTAQTFKSGSYVAGALLATGYIQFEVNGVAYKVLAST